MANQLGMAEQHTILVLSRRGWSHRRIARELGIHRETVARYLGLSQCEPARKARARAALRTMEENRTTSVERWQPVHRKNGSAPAAAHGATPEAAQQILSGTGAAAYPILAAVSAALSLRGSPQTPHQAELLPGKR